MATKLNQSSYDVRKSWIETNVSNKAAHRLKETTRKGKGSRANAKRLYPTRLQEAIKNTFDIKLT